MTDSKTDPRILRTRKLIMDSFVDLSGQKEFRDIIRKLGIRPLWRMP